MKNFSCVILLFAVFNLGAQHQFRVYDSIPVMDGERLLDMAWAGGLNSVNVQTLDLNGDGNEEIVTYDRMAGLPYIFRQTGHGIMPQNDLRVMLPDIDYNSWLMFADIDCDGDLDLFTNSSLGIVVYENGGMENGMMTWKELAAPLLTTGFSGKINLNVSGDDVPVIEDIDGDGDVDILVFNFVLGGVIHLNKNMAVENGSCDSYDFVTTNRRWGGVEECDCFEYAFGGEDCSNAGNGGRTTHEGGNSLMVIDSDDDQDMDLLMGHSTCRELLYFENVGDKDSAVFNDFSLGFNSFPGITDLLFPAGYYVDTDGDGNKEFIVTSNLATDETYENDYSSSIIQYEMLGLGQFALVTNRFMQEDMLDFGASSIPVSLDLDGDDDLDLLVAATGQSVEGNYYASVNVMINTGTRFEPSFEITARNFLNLADKKLTHPRMAIADFNDDDVPDLFFTGFDRDQFTTSSFIFYGDSESELLFGEGNFRTVEIDLKQYDSPTFYDEDGDGDQDMILGRRNGSLKLYENVGNEQFVIKNEEYLGISRDFSLTRLFLYPAIADVNGDGADDLITADMAGFRVYYNFINETDPEIDSLLSYNSVSGQYLEINPQQVNSLTFTDVFGSGKPALMAGGITGGLTLFKMADDEPPGGDQTDLKVFPNPVNNTNTLKVIAPDEGMLKIHDVSGRIIFEHTSDTGSFQLYVNALPAGMYIIKYQSITGRVLDAKVVKQ